MTAIYFTPIVKASSNHRYDTDNYEDGGPLPGQPCALPEPGYPAAARGIHIILDGVYNHTSSDSLYFDRYHRYSSDGGLRESLPRSSATGTRSMTNNMPLRRRRATTAGSAIPACR